MLVMSKWLEYKTFIYYLPCLAPRWLLCLPERKKYSAVYSISPLWFIHFSVREDNHLKKKLLLLFIKWWCNDIPQGSCSPPSVDIGRQFDETCPLILPCGAWGWSWGSQIGSKWPYTLSDLTVPIDHFFYVPPTHVTCYEKHWLDCHRCQLNLKSCI